MSALVAQTVLPSAPRTKAPDGKTVWVTLLFASVAFAAGPGGPVPGYILDSRSASIRPVLGLPGAMQLGPALGLSFNVTSAGFSPAGDYALAVNDQQHLYLVQQLATGPVTTDLGAVANNSRVLALNAGGTAAVIYSPDASELRFVTGLPQSASLSGPLSTASLAGPISAAALDDAGFCAIAGTGAIETVCADGSSQRILQPGLNVAAIAIVNKGQDLIVADQAGQQVLQVSQYAQSPASSVLASATDGINAPTGIRAVSANEILVADSGASALFCIDPTGQQSKQTIPLNIAPTQLRPLADPSILLLNDAASVPFTILDVSQMQTFFIPAN